MLANQQSRLDGVVNTLLTIVLVFPAVAFGAVNAWSELIIVVLVSLLAVAVLAREIAKSRRLRWSWTYIPIIVFLGLVLLQAIPLPISLVRTISPYAYNAWQQTSGTQTGAAPAWATLSVYPWGTWHDLRLLLVAVAMYLISFHQCRSYQETRSILWTISTIGVVVAFVFIVQRLAGTDRIYGLVPSPQDPSGPFVNYNNFAQFMNQCLGASLSILLMALFHKYRGRGHKKRDPNSPEKPEEPEPIKWKELANWPMLTLFFIILVDAITIPLSRSRAGTAGLGIGTLAILGLLMWKERTHQATKLLPIIATACVIVGLIVSEPLLFHRFSKLGEDTNTEFRLDVMRDAGVMFSKSPVLGFGQGAYRYSYPPFQRAVTYREFVYADCDYAQVLAETGSIGAICAVSFLGMIIWALYARISNRVCSLDVTAYGIAFSLICVLVGSTSDFGQRIPANTVINAVFCGMAMALYKGSTSERRSDSKTDSPKRSSRRSSRKSASTSDAPAPSIDPKSGQSLPVEPPAKDPITPVAPDDAAVGQAKSGAPETESSPEPAPSPKKPPLVGVTIFAILVVIAVSASILPGAIFAAVGEAYDKMATRTDDDIVSRWPAEPNDHQELIGEEKTAVWADPSNIRYRAKYIRFQLRALTLVANSKNMTVPWTGTTAKSALELIGLCKEARLIAPTCVDPYLIEIQIASLLGLNDETKFAVRVAQQLASHDLRVQMAAGVAGVVFGDDAQVISSFSLAIRSKRSSYPGILDLLIRQLHRPDLTVKLAGNDPERLLGLYDVLTAIPEADRLPGYDALVLQVKTMAMTSLEIALNNTKVDAKLYARYGQLKGDDASMEKYLARALSLQYDNVDWHLLRADALFRLGRYNEASEEARICMLLAPGRLDVRAMMGKIGSVPDNQMLPASKP